MRERVSVDALAEDVVGFVFRSKYGRDPTPEDLAFQKEFLLDGTFSVDTFARTQELSPEGRRILGTTRKRGDERDFVVDECRFSIPAASPLAECLARPAGYEPWVWPHFLDLCRPGMTVVDAGANWGIYTIPAARRVGPGGKVFAFEVAPDNAKTLLRNALLNGLDNIELLTFAVSDRFGMAAIPRDRPLNSGHVSLDRADAMSVSDAWEPVSTVPMDAMRAVMGRVDLMKLDIEGAEYRACLGARALIAEDRPVVFAEFCPALLSSISGVDPGALLGFFLDLGYTIEILHFVGAPERVSGSRGEVIERIRRQSAEDRDHTLLDLKLTPP